MRRMRAALTVILLVTVSCRKHEIPPPPPKPSDTFVTTPAPLVKREWGNARFDVCSLLTKEQVGQIQGGSVTQTKNAGGTDDSLFISQCFYMTAEAQLAVALSVIEKDSSTSQRMPVDLWKEMFGGGKKKAEADRDGEELEESKRRERLPPQPVAGLDHEAYWAAGALYVLIGDKILRIAVSGPDSLESKLNKAKALGQTAIGHL